MRSLRMAHVRRVVCVLTWTLTLATTQPAAAQSLGATPPEVVPLLAQSKFKELDAKLRAITVPGTACPSTDCPQDEAIDTLAVAARDDETLRPMIDAWLKVSKQRFALLVKGKLEEAVAWRERGSGFSKTVEKDAWPRFYAHLELAERFYRQAIERDPKAIEAPARLVGIALFQGKPGAEIVRRFKAALAVDPVSVEAHNAMMVAVSEKWGGSNDASIAFAREVRKQHPESGSLASLLIRAHKEKWRRTHMPRDYFRDPAVWGELSSAFDALLASEPDSKWGNNQLAFLAWRAGDRARSKQAFEKIGNEWESLVWDDSRPMFNLARTWAMADSASPASAAPAP
jgi:hypothetical protein